MDLQRAFDEANKRLRTLNDQMCCLTDAVQGAYNSISPRTIDSGDSFTLLAGDVHSFSWDLSSGSSLRINNGITNAYYSSNGSVEFSTVNSQDITLTATSGEVRILYIS